MGADRGLIADFKAGDRISRYAATAEGSAPVSEENEHVSLAAPGFRDLYAAHIDGECWVYEFGENMDLPLDRAASKTGAKILVSYPLFKSATHQRPWGAVSVSFNDDLVDGDKVCAAMRESALEIGPLLSPP